MVELKQQEMEGKLQFHSHLTLMAQVLVPCWNQMHVCIFESSQLECSYVGDLLCIDRQIDTHIHIYYTYIHRVFPLTGLVCSLSFSLCSLVPVFLSVCLPFMLPCFCLYLFSLSYSFSFLPLSQHTKMLLKTFSLTSFENEYAFTCQLLLTKHFKANNTFPASQRKLLIFEKQPTF